jgi:hypothetical protein
MYILKICLGRGPISCGSAMRACLSYGTRGCAQAHLTRTHRQRALWQLHPAARRLCRKQSTRGSPLPPGRRRRRRWRSRRRRRRRRQQAPRRLRHPRCLPRRRRRRRTPCLQAPRADPRSPAGLAEGGQTRRPRPPRLLRLHVAGMGPCGGARGQVALAPACRSWTPGCSLTRGTRRRRPAWAGCPPRPRFGLRARCGGCDTGPHARRRRDAPPLRRTLYPRAGARCVGLGGACPPSEGLPPSWTAGCGVRS